MPSPRSTKCGKDGKEYIKQDKKPFSIFFFFFWSFLLLLDWHKIVCTNLNTIKLVLITIQHSLESFHFVLQMNIGNKFIWQIYRDENSPALSIESQTFDTVPIAELELIVKSLNYSKLWLHSVFCEGVEDVTLFSKKNWFGIDRSKIIFSNSISR